MELVTQALAVCGLFYSRPPAAIRNPGHPPAAHLAPILEEMHAGRGAWFRSPCRPLRSLRSERAPAQAQEWGGAAGAGELEPAVPATGSPLIPQRPENLTSTSNYSPGLRVDAVGEHVWNLEDRGRSLPIRIIGGERGTKLGEVRDSED